MEMFFQKLNWSVIWMSIFCLWFVHTLHPEGLAEYLDVQRRDSWKGKAGNVAMTQMQM